MRAFAIHSKRVILENIIRDATVVIDNGRIEAVLEGMAAVDCPVYSVGSKVLMAGVIDPHVHINEPGRAHWEGFDTATRAAIAGGITSLVEMPLNASPVTTTVAAFEQKLAAANGKLHANVGFWGGIVPGNTHEIEGLIARGVIGFKAFLTHSGIDEFPNATEDDLRKAMPVIAKYGLPLLVHCELSELAKSPLDNAVTQRSYWQYMLSRPKEWEEKAIGMMIRLCEETGCRTHIVHLSAATAIVQIKAAKEKGLPLTVETAQHYLYFNAEEIPDGNTAFKCAPPIRERANNALLWQALKEGVIDLVATDHSPAPPDIKQIETGDLIKAWGGIASIQLALPILWTAAIKHNYHLTDIARWLCTNSARLAGLQHKGKIEIGYDADLIVWDPEADFTVTADMLHHRHKLTPYLGERLKGIVEATFLKGEKVYENGRFIQLQRGNILLNTISQ